MIWLESLGKGEMGGACEGVWFCIQQRKPEEEGGCGDVEEGC